MNSSSASLENFEITRVKLYTLNKNSLEPSLQGVPHQVVGLSANLIDHESTLLKALCESLKGSWLRELEAVGTDLEVALVPFGIAKLVLPSDVVLRGAVVLVVVVPFLVAAHGGDLQGVRVPNLAERRLDALTGVTDVLLGAITANPNSKTAVEVS